MAMTPEHLQARWLSLDSWLKACLAPVALGLIGLIGLILLSFAAGVQGETLDAVAGSLGAVALMVIGYQAIDILAARGTHRKLLEHAPRRYRAHLAAITQAPRTSREVFDLLDWIEQDLHV